MRTQAQFLHQHGLINHRRLNLDQNHCLVEWKKQTLADLENISYVFIVNDLNFQSKRIYHENNIVLEPLHLKTSPPLEMQYFPI